MGVFDDMAEAERAASAERVDAAKQKAIAAEQARQMQFKSDCMLLEQVALPVFEEAKAAFLAQGIAVGLECSWKGAGPDYAIPRITFSLSKAGDRSFSSATYVRAIAKGGVLEVGTDLDTAKRATNAESFAGHAQEAIRKALEAYMRALEPKRP